MIHYFQEGFIEYDPRFSHLPENTYGSVVKVSNTVTLMHFYYGNHMDQLKIVRTLTLCQIAELLRCVFHAVLAHSFRRIPTLIVLLLKEVGINMSTIFLLRRGMKLEDYPSFYFHPLKLTRMLISFLSSKLLIISRTMEMLTKVSLLFCHSQYP